MRDFEDRQVVVTGGAGALGAAVVEALIERGARVSVPVLAPRELDSFRFRNHDRVAVRAGLDFTTEETVQRYYAELPSCWASIHLAGGFSMGPFADTSLTGFLELMNMNAVTCFLACREAAKRIRAGGVGGRIVNVAAKPALTPTGSMTAYAASKAVVVSLTRSLGEELSPEGILVNAVAPSVIDTPANRAAMPAADRGSWSTPAEIAGAILFLASPENAATRGAVLPV